MIFLMLAFPVAVGTGLKAQTMEEVNGPLQEKWTEGLPKPLQVELFVSHQFDHIRNQYRSWTREVNKAATGGQASSEEQGVVARKVLLGFFRSVERAAKVIAENEDSISELSPDVRKKAKAITELNVFISSLRANEEARGINIKYRLNIDSVSFMRLAK